MRCLMCGKELGEGSLQDILFGEDVLCSSCRKEWKQIKQSFTLEGVKGYSEYLYNDAFAKCLLQYKECGDEALKDVFLYPVRKKLKKRYRGSVLCLMPSSKEKMAERGFSHLRRIFESTELEILEPFLKNEERSQKELSYPERQQMRDNLTLKEGVILPKKIVLCDDVITTGATLKGALQCIDLSHHEVGIYTVAADLKERPIRQGGEWV